MILNSNPRKGKNKLALSSKGANNDNLRASAGATAGKSPKSAQLQHRKKLRHSLSAQSSARSADQERSLGGGGAKGGKRQVYVRFNR